MATCKQTASELIQDIFSPCVAVLCSSDVEAICAKNNLTFVELVQPFCRLNTEVTIRDPSNVPCSIRNLRIVMKDICSPMPSLNIGRKVMHDAVASSVVNSSDGVFCSTVNNENYQLKHCASTPWFEAYREVFFQVVSPMEHEFMHHYLSCIFVVSSSHQDPLSQISDLCQQHTQFQLHNSPHNSRWFFSYIFKYYLLLHDTSSESLAKAEAIYQSMKSSFGSSVCHLLQINSSCKSESNNLNSHEDVNETSNLPDPWSQFFPKYYPPQDALLNDAKDDVEAPKDVEEPPNVSESGDCQFKRSRTKKDIIDHPLQNNSDDVMANDSCAEVGDKVRPRTSSLNYGYWSKSQNRNKKHGLCLTLSDMDRIRVFVQDFCIQGLVPFVEKQIRILNDQVTNRKSIHRTLFGVTKKLFTGNKPGVQSPVASTNSVVYGQDAPELQVRKLGDLAFMFQLFEVAYQAYHTAKRDFSADQAWLHFAGASEMAALSVFMQGNSNLHEYPARYMETALVTYLHTCKLPELAMRATFLSAECLKAKGLYRDAAFQFMRIQSEADLPCALFLEQAAHCFINCKPPKVRKYAFHMVLAGHRYSKAGQKKHGLRCYRQAEQIYNHINWTFANNHINTMIGRFSLNLNQLEGACDAFKELLLAHCEHPLGDQSNQLRDYLWALKQCLVQQPSHENSQLPCLPIPFIECQSTKVLLGDDNAVDEAGCLIIKSRGFLRDDVSNHVWERLEEILIGSLNKTMPLIFSPQLYCLTQNTNNLNKPIIVANETITIEVVLKNPLNIELTVENLFLLWTYTANPDVTSNKEPVSFSNELEFTKAMMLSSLVQTEFHPQVKLQPLREHKLHFTLKPVHIGSLLVKGLSFSLQSPQYQSDHKGTSDIAKVDKLSIQGKQLIELKGPRLNKTAAERATKVYAIDNRLNLEITNSMPRLQVKYQSFPHALFCGEVERTLVEFSNVGQQVLHRIVATSPTPAVFSFGSGREMKNSAQIYNEVPCNRHPVPVTVEWGNCDWKCEIQMSDSSPCHLEPGETLTVPMWLRGPDVPGEHCIELLFYYEMEPPHSRLSHRLLQHSFVLITKSSLNLQASALTSQRFEESANGGSLILSLEIGNLSEELSEMSVVQVSCSSPKWYLSSSDENRPKGFPVILPRECLLLTLKAASFSFQNKDSSHETIVLSHVPLGCFEVDSSAIPCSDFTSKSTIPVPDFMTDSQVYAVNGMQNMLLLLTVIWKAKVQSERSSQLVMGQHHIKIVNLSSASNQIIPQGRDALVSSDYGPSLSFPVPSQLVSCYLKHSFHVQHDFTKKRLVSVPVDFIAQSISNISLRVIVDNTDSFASSRSLFYAVDESQSPVSQHFTWVNGSRCEILLNPGETARIPLRASFCNPGTYNLGCLGVSISCSNEAAVTYIMQPYLIIISACSTLTL